MASLSFCSSCATDFQVDDLVAKRERGVSSVEEPDGTRNYVCTCELTLCVCITYTFLYTYGRILVGAERCHDT